MADSDPEERKWWPQRKGEFYIPIPIGLLIKLVKWISKRVFGR